MNYKERSFFDLSYNIYKYNYKAKYNIIIFIIKVLGGFMKKKQVSNDNLRLMVFESAASLGEKIDKHLL